MSLISLPQMTIDKNSLYELTPNGFEKLCAADDHFSLTIKHLER